MIVRWTPTALGDLNSLHAYISGDNLSAADATVEKILAAIDAICRNPEMGKSGRLATTRELVVPPFVIAYRIRRGIAEILAIVHGARRWPDKF